MSCCLRTLRPVVLFCAAVAIGAPAWAQQPAAKPPAKPAAHAGTATAKDPVVAIVNGQQVHLSDLEIARQGLPAQYRNLAMSALFPGLLSRIIDSKMLVQEARKAKIQDDAEFKRRLAFLGDQLLQEEWLQRELAKEITADKLKQQYEERIKSMPPEDEVKARHILVGSEDEAKKLIEEIKKGAAFDKLAKEKSTDKASGAEGGELGWFKKGDMVKEFADAAFGLKKGELSDKPIKTQFGYHVVQVEDRRTAPPPPFEEIADQIRADLSREAVTKIVDKLRSGAKIEKFNMDGSKADAKAPAPAAPKTPAAPAQAPKAPAAPATPPAAAPAK